MGLGLMKLYLRISTLTHLSSPKGLRAESARAVTGRPCPHSGEGEDFLTRQPGFFYENGRNSGMENWGHIENFFVQKPRFLAQKKHGFKRC